ncbi:unnamed protein product [Protopolystoma xenopodis]|uniref:Cadherin domain-containing protein n=1 Tax=Protopolystoma xenopodis TaxID=117903 RepID=A0A3S5A5C7_9PLAT|nr:unnamed protein product [Protopolystoma xenopodis]
MCCLCVVRMMCSRLCMYWLLVRSTAVHLLLVVVALPSRLVAEEMIPTTASLIVLEHRLVEERPLGQVVLRLADELSRLSGASLRYHQFHLLPMQDAGLFRVTPDGRLVTVQRVDRESICGAAGRLEVESRRVTMTTTTTTTASSRRVCLLQLQATALEYPLEAAGPRRLRQLLVQLRLVDVNDNPPICQVVAGAGSAGQLDVPEDAPVDSLVARVRLTDADSRHHGILGASLLGPAVGDADLLPFRAQFDLASAASASPMATTTHADRGPWSSVDVVLRLIRRLDYDRLQPEFALRLVVWDSGRPDGANVAEADDDSNGDGDGDGEDTVIGARLTTTCSLQIRVRDVNDHSPVWTAPRAIAAGLGLTLAVFEGELEGRRELVCLEARDADVGANAKLRYELVEETGEPVNSVSPRPELDLFQLQPDSGCLQLRTLPVDFEAVAARFPRLIDRAPRPGWLPVRLNVRAVDQPQTPGEAARSSPVARLTVWLVDVNDNEPQVQIIGLQPASPGAVDVVADRRHTHDVVVAENLPAGEPVAAIFTHDADADAGTAGQGRVTCRLEETGQFESGTGESAFRLVEVAGAASGLTYQLVTRRPLDHEAAAVHLLRLACADGPAPAGLELEEEGVLRFGRPRFDQLTTHRLIRVLVADVNDNPPRILAPLQPHSSASPAGPDEPDAATDSLACSVAEHSSVGTRICQLRAWDADSGGNRRLEWWLDESASRGWLALHPQTGWLTVAPAGLPTPQKPAGLDREHIDELHFTVFVRDGLDTAATAATAAAAATSRLTASASLVLTVVDINDQPPRMPDMHYFAVLESAAPGTTVGQIRATDADLPGSRNAQIAYRTLAIQPAKLADLNDQTNAAPIDAGDERRRRQQQLLRQHRFVRKQTGLISEFEVSQPLPGMSVAL